MYLKIANGLKGKDLENSRKVKSRSRKDGVHTLRSVGIDGCSQANFAQGSIILFLRRKTTIICHSFHLVSVSKEVGSNQDPQP